MRGSPKASKSLDHFRIETRGLQGLIQALAARFPSSSPGSTPKKGDRVRQRESLGGESSVP